MTTATTGLTLRQRQLFEERLRAAGIGTAGSAPAVRERPRRVPLGSAQRRFLLLDQLEPGNPAFHIAAPVKLSGDLDVAALRRSLELLVTRHEALRTAFPLEDGESWQEILPPAGCPLPLTDLSDRSTDERAEELARLSASEATAPFDLRRGPLMRLRLVRLAPDQHVLLLAVHHIAADGWSVGVLVREVCLSYAALCRGADPGLAPVEFQYADHAMWEAEREAAGELTEGLAYWDAKLAGAGPLELPRDGERAGVRSFRGAHRSLRMPAELAARVREMAAREGASPFISLLTGLSVVLGRLSGQEDVLLGTPVAGREQPAAEAAIGCFLNTVALRADLSGDPSFRDLLHRVRATCVDAYNHASVPFERVLGSLEDDRTPGLTPLISVLVNMLNMPAATAELPGVTVEFGQPQNVGAKFDLTVYIREEEDSYELTLQYNADLFRAARIDELARQWLGVLDQGLAAPDRPVGKLTLVTDGARGLPDPAQALEAGPGTTVLDLFDAAVRRAPDASALDDGGEQVSYAEVDAHTHRVAHHLRDRGLEPGAGVAVLGSRRPELVYALLGAWRQGLVCTVLDPAMPDANLAACLDACTPQAVLDTRDFASWLAPVTGGVVGASHAPRTGAAARTAPPAPGDVAYLTFTSGTTGAPKAVRGTHAPLAHFVQWERETFMVGPGDRCALLSGIGHDPLLRDILTPLCSGATVCLPPSDDLADEERLARWLRESGVTMAHLTPAMTQLIAATADAEGCPALRLVLVGGDVLTTRVVSRLRKLAPEADVVNVYGATETPQVMGYHRVGPDGAPLDSFPVGTGIDGVQLLVLNRAGQLCGIGEVGEITVRTPHLSLGYLGRPELTAERFPAAPGTGDRMFRTGDLGRYDTDGLVHFAGRSGGVVKIRGHRIETAEVESVLADCPAVREVAVVVDDGALVAYAVAHEGPEETNAAVRLARHAADHLPPVMRPREVVTLPRLPRTATGKPDRRALSALAVGRARPSAEPPQGPVETLIAKHVSAVLEGRAVDRSTSFFQLGGDSVRAMRLTARLRKALDREVPLRLLFSHPSVAALAEGLAADDGPAKAGSWLVPRPEGTPPPLSYAQQRLWFLNRLDPGSAAYNVPAAIELAGQLDPAALESALRDLIERHHTLRTTVTGPPEAPVLQLHPVPREPVTLHQASSGQQTVELVHALACRPFDLVRELPVRAHLIRHDAERHVLLLVVHHIATDGWSMGLLLDELSTLYQAHTLGSASGLPEITAQYADYAYAQRQLPAARAERQAGYWAEKLAGVTPMPLPTDHPYPAGHERPGARTRFRIPAAARDALRELAAEEGTTLFAVLLAAFQVTLHRYTGETDIPVGIPVTNRPTPEIQRLVGLFVNTLVIRGDLAGDPTLRETIRRTHAVCQEAYDHQDLPFEQVVQRVAADRETGRSPLFQVMFVLQNPPTGRPALGDVRMAPIPVDAGTAQFELSLVLREDADGVGGHLEYRTDLFEETTARRIAAAYAEVLTEAAAGGEPTLAGPALPDPAEAEWNDTGVPCTDRNVVELFEAQVGRTPEAVAVSDGEESLTYAELDAQAERLAAVLRAHGAAQDRLVAVCLPRGTELVAAMLSVLKSGAGYVPMDPGHPPGRLAHILDDAAPVAVVARTAPVPGHPVPVVSPDTAAPADPPWPAGRIHGDSIAYVIYTSGTTGRPKGVMVPHAALANHMMWMGRTFPLTPADRVLQKTPCDFDASVWEFYAPLLTGARLEMARPGGHRDAAYLVRTVAERRITVLQLVPSVLDVLLGTDGFGRCDSLRRVFCGGEALSPALRDRFREASQAELVNLYGPTEACIDATYWRTRAASDLPSLVPIGQPIAGVQARVLDARLRPVPIGVVGELCISGGGLARGYVGSPALTAERFVPDPWGPPGSRLYRTGDLARWRHDGVLEYRGRADRQVKIRGHRVEPEEIRTALLCHPGVTGAVVTAVDSAGGTRLVGHYAPATVDAEELRLHLAGQLPAHMVPSYLIPLTAIPLTPNGKADHQALPAPPQRTSSAGRSLTTPDEQLVGRLCARLLGIDGPLGADDNFFTLGGNSLLAMRLVADLGRELGREIPVREVFDQPTLSALAARLRRVPRRPAVPGPHHGLATDPMPLSATQHSLWLLDRMQRGRTDYHVPMAVELHGDLDTAALRQALTGIVTRHEILRTRYELAQGTLRQIIDAPADLPLDTGDFTPQLLHAAAREPFELAGDWPVRASLLRQDARRHVLLLTVHHIATDGWSARVLLRDLTELYRAARDARTAVLPELPVRYADYAAWQHSAAVSGRHERQLGYWEETLTGSGATGLAGPGRERRAADRPSTSLPLSVGRDLRERLARLAAEEDTTVFALIYAAFAALVAEVTGQREPNIGTDAAGREAAEVQDVLGPFVNQLVLRMDVGAAPDARSLVRRAGTVCRDAFENQAVPYEQVARQLAGGADVQIKLVYDALPVPGEPDALAVGVMKLPSPTTKFDLTLFLWDGPQGIDGELQFATDVVDAEVATALRDHFPRLLHEIADDPDRPLHALLPGLAPASGPRHDEDNSNSAHDGKATMAHTQAPARGPVQFKNVKAAAISLTGPAAAAPQRAGLARLVGPQCTGDALASWIRVNGDQLDEQLADAGAVLFRGHDIATAAAFEEVAEAICGPLVAENGEHVPVAEAGHVQTPVFYPPEKHLLWHNENSFNARWPLRIVFCCNQAPAVGGETPLVDSRDVYDALDVSIRRRFTERGVRYHRVYQEALGLTWQQVFGTDDRTAAEAHCRVAGLQYDWLDGDRLRTSCVRPAVVRHAGSGRMSWFNQAQHWHTSCLDPQTREALQSLCAEGELPRSCTYGDGSPIEEAVMEEILDVYRDLEKSFVWQPGDVLAVDNVAAAHARNPYQGDRKLFVAMGGEGRFESGAES
ncbi:amino acid adenylation domain-containing protein [Streptomyces canus]|uniref:amino acid adenylation domain-containing protein n=1 Tax=Streptomyces canus TaxID=58343 RepID=UPI0036C9599A